MVHTVREKERITPTLSLRYKAIRGFHPLFDTRVSHRDARDIATEPLSRTYIHKGLAGGCDDPFNHRYSFTSDTKIAIFLNITVEH